MAEVTVALGGQTYTVRRMPTMRALAWRKRAAKVVDAIPGIKTEFEQEGDDLLKMAGRLLGVADEVVAEMVALVIDASTELQADRDHIYEAAFDEEYLEAFQSILLLNAPLAGAASSITASPGEPSETT